MNKKVLEYKDVEIKLDSDLKILGLTLIVYEGEFVFLIGKTGSGKSSILKSMYSENKILDGEAKISNTNLKTISEKNIPFLRRKIGVIFQDFQLLKDRTVYKNLEFVLDATGWGNQNEKKDRIENFSRKVLIKNSFDIATARAVSNPSTVAEYIMPTLLEEGYGILYCGKWNNKDQKKLEKTLDALKGEIIEIKKKSLPKNRGTRNTIFIKPKGICPAAYPRDIGKAEKYPIID